MFQILVAKFDYRLIIKDFHIFTQSLVENEGSVP